MNGRNSSAIAETGKYQPIGLEQDVAKLVKILSLNEKNKEEHHEEIINDDSAGSRCWKRGG